MKFLVCLSVSMLISVGSAASCLPIESEQFTGKFDIVKKDMPVFYCTADSKNVRLAKSLLVQVKGCVLSLKLKKIVRGAAPKITMEKDGIYKIFSSDDELCSKSVGLEIERKIKSIRTECCQTRLSTLAKNFSCNTESKIEFLSPPEEKEVRCNQDDVRWELR